MTSILKVQNIQYTDGDSAITIADGGGVTLASDLTVDTTTLKVDSANNRVGIGTASPDTEFHVKGAGTVMNIEGTGGSSFIGLKDSDDGTVGFMGVDGGSIKFQTSGSSYSDKLVINAAGQVTKPSQPAFKVARATSVQTINSQAWTKVEFNHSYVNDGSHFNITGSGTNPYAFTAPVAGTYLFSVAINYNNASALGGYYYAALYKNGAVADGQTYLNGLRMHNNTYQESDTQFIGATTLKLAANDYIHAYAYAHFSGSTGGLAMGGRTYMTGYLLG